MLKTKQCKERSYVGGKYFVNWNIATTTYFNCGFSVPVRALLLLRPGVKRCWRQIGVLNGGKMMFPWPAVIALVLYTGTSKLVYILTIPTAVTDCLPKRRTFPQSSSIVHHKFWLNRKATARVFVDHLSDINPFFQRGLLRTDHLIYYSSYLSSLIAFSLNNLVYIVSYIICNKARIILNFECKVYKIFSHSNQPLKWRRTIFWFDIIN